MPCIWNDCGIFLGSLLGRGSPPRRSRASRMAGAETHLQAHVEESFLGFFPLFLCSRDRDHGSPELSLRHFMAALNSHFKKRE